ncbi:MAG: SDR family oxidoreductase [Runella slithyformis]|nr:MAG: SDR family oxidoreductase [Runella slithyformis]
MNNKIAIVTGVSRLKGIGFAICTELAKRNFDIFFTYWTHYDNQMPWKVGLDEPAQIQNEIIKLGVKCEKLELNLALINSVELLFNEVQNKLGQGSVLVNNATYSTQTDIDNFLVTELDKHYEINLRATTLLTIEFIKRFNLQQGGRIINLTSGQSLGEMSNEIAYAVTKGAIETLTKTISQRIATKGITINAVNPGPTDTGWMDENLTTLILEKSPMGRIGTPKDASRLIAFLASDEAEWITGQIIHSEGGFTR